jgi:flagellar assembly protein FliH
LYNRIFKNGQISYGVPFQVRIPTDEGMAAEELTPDDSYSFDDMDDTDTGETYFTEDEIPELAEKTPEQLIDEARSDAEALIREAEVEASKIVEAARLEAEARASQIEEEAWQKGYAEGIEAAAKQYEHTLKEADAIRSEAAEQHDRILSDMEDEIIALVNSVAKKVIARELMVDREYIIDIVKQAIEQCSNKAGLIVKVSPDDYEFLTENKDNLLSVLEGVSDIDIRQELSLKQGACIVETPFGSMDAGVHTKLRKIEEAFDDILKGK